MIRLLIAALLFPSYFVDGDVGSTSRGTTHICIIVAPRIAESGTEYSGENKSGSDSGATVEKIALRTTNGTVEIFAPNPL